jgi:hypothetical protein
MKYIVTTDYQLDKVAAPNLPVAPDQWDRRFQDQFGNVLRLYFNRLDDFIARLKVSGATGAAGAGLTFPYGAFHDTTTQTQVATSTAKAITFNATDSSNGIALGTPTSRVVTSIPGYYNFQFSAQLDKASGATASIWIWPKVNGTNITASASKVSIQGTTAENVPAWNFVLPMNANDYFELYWMTDDTNVQLKYEAGFGTAPNNVPAIPSVILTATFVSALPT